MLAESIRMYVYPVFGLDHIDALQTRLVDAGVFRPLCVCDHMDNLNVFRSLLYVYNARELYTKC